MMLLGSLGKEVPQASNMVWKFWVHLAVEFWWCTFCCTNMEIGIPSSWDTSSIHGTFSSQLRKLQLFHHDKLPPLRKEQLQGIGLESWMTGSAKSNILPISSSSSEPSMVKFAGRCLPCCHIYASLQSTAIQCISGVWWGKSLQLANKQNPDMTWSMIFHEILIILIMAYSHHYIPG